MDPLAPIPTPPAQRWREFRIQALPVLTFVAVLACIVTLWHNYVLPTSIVGEVESIHADIISVLPGTIKELKVKRFQRVSAGEEIALVSTMDTETLQASLRAIEADLKLMRERMQIDVVRNDNTYQQLRLEYLKERVDIDLERVNAYYYELEAVRLEKLLTNNPPLIDKTTYEATVRLAASARTNVIEREMYLAEKERTIQKLVPSTHADEAILEAIKAQEDQLNATSQTVSLKSPIDGMVNMVMHYAGAKIVPNVPIVSISATQATRIVGYVRRPFNVMPKAGDTVEIRRQSFKREIAQGMVIEVAGQLEPISTNLVVPANGMKAELGLPFEVSIPAELALIPGEPVDLIFSRR